LFSQALAKNPDNFKAQFRKGKAQAEMGYIEKALVTLEDLMKKDESRMSSSLTTHLAFPLPLFSLLKATRSLLLSQRKPQ
jgi:thioredoxin-like negative regulator of GroEL